MKIRFFAAGLVFSFAGAASAMSVDWSGTYRAEWIQVNKPNLGEPSQTKSYGLNYLSLSPKIVASDGINISGKFDILGSSDPAYANSQTGMLWGESTSTAPVDGHNTLGNTKEFSSVRVSQLYMTLEQEYGSLLIGRAPFEFGLGMLYNAGNGAFDHWLTTSDFVAYKFIVGNLSFTPMIGRTHVPDLATNATRGMTTDTIFNLQYESKDSGSLFGIMMARRRGAGRANDIDPATVGGTGSAGGYTMETTGAVLERTWEKFEFKMEAQFLKGHLGYDDAGGSAELEHNAYGIAVEMNLPRPSSKWEGGLRLGMASGDNPDTESQEGFFFHRNYDVAMLMFNHRMGVDDLLGTNDFVKDAGHNLANSLDDETVSNVAYLAPELRYAWSPKMVIKNSLVYAQLMATSGAADATKDLGFEWDLTVEYKPRENVRWENRLGVLFPGSGFKNGTDRDNAMTYGIETRAAITF